MASPVLWFPSLRARRSIWRGRHCSVRPQRLSSAKACCSGGVGQTHYKCQRTGQRQHHNRYCCDRAATEYSTLIARSESLYTVSTATRRDCAFSLGAFSLRRQLPSSDISELFRHIRASVESLERIFLDHANTQREILDAVSVRPGNKPSNASDGTAIPGKWAYSVKELSALLGISRTTIWRMARAGELLSVKVGSRTLFRAVDLPRWLQRELQC
jgi:excisionase family DNA binding protein